MYLPQDIVNTAYSNERFFQKKEGMHEMHFNPKNISPQIIYLLHHYPHLYHIRDQDSRYLYLNIQMSALLNSPTAFPL